MPKDLEENYVETQLSQKEAAQELSQSDVLDMLLSAEPPQEITAEVPIKRIGASFTVHAITYEQYARLERNCQKLMKSGRSGQLKKQVDEEKLSIMMILEACVNPNFKSQQVKDQLTARFQVADVTDAMKKLLLIGEITEISNAILDISGFEDNYEEIKN